jgi:dihydroorotase
MAGAADLIVRNGTVVIADATAEADVAIRDGKFVAIAPRGSLDLVAAEQYDATGLFVLPGVIDGHVHFREPGFEYKEDWRTGSAAAAIGGVTTVIDMPNTNPRTASAEAVEAKRGLAESKSYVDFGIVGLLSQDNVAAIRSMAAAGVVGFKVFLGDTVGNVARPDDGMLLDGLREVAATGLRIGFHAENNEIVQHGIQMLKAAGRSDPLAHVDSRPVVAEVESIQRMGLFALSTGARIHIFHLSSREGLDMIEAWRDREVDLTCETGAHYAFLKAEDMERLGSRLRVNPPVRYGREGHGDALLDALADGRVDMIASDHAPHTREEKLNADVWQALSGFPGVETSVRLFLTNAVNAGRMSLQQFVRATSEGPARTWDLFPRKGTIRVGSDADLTIVDLAAEGVIRDEELHSKNAVTPFDGTRTKGAPVGTIVRGRIVMRDGALTGAPAGRAVRPERAVGGGSPEPEPVAA